MTIDWQAAGVIVALALGFANLWFGNLQPRRERRRQSGRADMGARLEKFFRADTGSTQGRLVLTNYGPAVARGVTVDSVTDHEGNSVSDAIQFRWHLPVEAVHPHQDHHLLLSGAGKQPEGITLRWSDATGTQQKAIWLSPHYV